MLLRDIGQTYRTSWAFALACPLLFAIPVLVELLQHFVELQAGMYVDTEGARAAEQGELRMQLGFAKTLALLLPGYWFARFVLFQGDGQRAAQIEMPAFGLWLVIFAIMAVNMWLGLFGPSLGQLAGLDEDGAMQLSIALGVLEAIAMIFLSAWLVAWPVGNAALGPIKSVRIMGGSFWYAAALFVAGFLPLMAIHYGLAIAAVLWLPAWLDWLAMVIDAILVGFLALTMTGATVFGARRAAARKGVDLLPAQIERATVSVSAAG